MNELYSRSPNLQKGEQILQAFYHIPRLGKTKLNPAPGQDRKHWILEASIDGTIEYSIGQDGPWGHRERNDVLLKTIPAFDAEDTL